MLDENRIEGVADGVKQVASLPDPCGKTVYEYEKENGLKIKKITVPLGVIGIIYEAQRV